MLGALTIGIVSEAAASIGGLSALKQLVAFAVLIGMLLLRPQGILLQHSGAARAGAMSGAAGWDFVVITLLVYLGVNLIGCLALNLQYGTAGVLNFAFIVFVAVGAYTAALCSVGPSSGNGGFQTYVGDGTFHSRCHGSSRRRRAPWSRCRSAWSACGGFAATTRRW